MKSRAGYWLGSALIVVGIAGAVAWLIVLLVGISFNIDGWLRVGVPADAIVLLEARDYVVYDESPTAADEPNPSVRVQILDARTGAEVPVAPYQGSFTYDVGHQGTAIGTFTAPRRGSYRIVTTTESSVTDTEIAFGDSVGSVGKQIVLAIGGSIVIGTVLGLTGLILLIMTGVRRARVRRVAAPTDSWRGLPAP